MTVTLLAEQLLNGIQFGLMLFLLAAGLTLVFGIMDVLNLAHGSLYMIGAYIAASVAQATGSFWIALPAAVAATGLVGLALEVTLIRRLYRRDHLSQVLATFAVILIADDLVKLIWGPAPIMLSAPAALAGRPRAGSRPLPVHHEDAHRHAGARRQQQSRNGNDHGRAGRPPVRGDLHAGCDAVGRRRGTARSAARR
jgi:branched-subunit amino acid ABC-type transport system permease component